MDCFFHNNLHRIENLNLDLIHPKNFILNDLHCSFKKYNKSYFTLLIRNYYHYVRFFSFSKIFIEMAHRFTFYKRSFSNCLLIFLFIFFDNLTHIMIFTLLYLTNNHETYLLTIF